MSLNARVAGEMHCASGLDHIRYIYGITNHTSEIKTNPNKHHESITLIRDPVNYTMLCLRLEIKTIRHNTGQRRVIIFITYY